MQDNKLDSRARLVLAGAAVAVFFTAFEVKYPVLPLGPVSFTDAELAAGFFFVTAALWAKREGFVAFFSRKYLDLAVFLFVASNFISVLAAEDKPSAFKFALRMMYAALIYVGISRLPQKANSHLLIARTITVALLIVSAIGFASNFVSFIDWPWLLSPFQEAISTFGAFYNVRVSSTLPFPTALSMYLELAAPIALVLGIWMIDREKDSRRRRWLTIATVVLLAGVMTVQVFTFTRSSLVATPLSMLTGAVMAAVFGYGRRVWGMFLMGAVLLVAITGASIVLSSKMSARLEITEQEQFYGAEYKLIKFPEKLSLDQKSTAVVQVKNTGSITWKGKGDDSVFLGFRWLTYPDKHAVKDIPWAQAFPSQNVPSGGVVTLTTDFYTPPDPGKYVLIFDLIQSHVSWFSGAFVPPLVVPVEFTGNEGKTFAIAEPATDFVAAEPEQFQASRTQLWSAAFKLWKQNPVLGVGPDQFRHRYPDVAPDLPPDPRLETHNIFVQALTDTGLIGLVVMIFLLASALWAQFKLVRNRSLKPFERYVSLALMVATIAYITHGMLDYYLWQAGLAFLFFTIMGLTAWLCERAKTRERFTVIR